MRSIAMATWLGAALSSCSGLEVAPAEPTPVERVEAAAPGQPGSQPSADEHAPGGGGRPVTLNYKDERERQALLGLSYEGGRVSIDPAEAARLVSAVDPQRARLEFEAGLASVARNARLEGIAAHTRAVLLDPANARMYEGLGDALRAERLESRAEAAYRTGLELEPSASLFVRLAEILWMRADREGALEAARSAVELDAASARAHADLARWYYFVNDYAAAWEHVHRCEAIGADLPSQFRPLLASQMTEPRR